MASVDVMKWQRANLHSGGIRTHFEDELRKTCGHSNIDIDRTKTPLNFWIGATGFNDVLQKIDDRVAAVDAIIPPLRVKKDRITSITIEIPCPKKLSDQGKSKEFFEKAYATLGKFLGEENLLGMTVHVDEVHDYMDHGEQKISLEHAHAFCVPFSKSKGINAKTLITPAFLRECTQVIHDMCKKEFDYEYKTGEYARQQDVKQLKAASYKELLLSFQELEQAYDALKALSDELRHDTQLKQEFLDQQTETAICDVYKLLEPLKQRAGERVKRHKVVIKDGDAYVLIAELERSIIKYVQELREFSRNLPSRQQEIESLEKHLEASKTQYEALKENLQDEITRRSKQLAHEDYRQYVQDTSRDISRGLNQMLAAMHKVGLNVAARQILEDNPYLEQFTYKGFDDRIKGD